MRQPTFSRSRRRTRQQRLLRTGIGVVVIVVLAALVANLVGGGKKKGPGESPIATVSFVASVKGETDGAKKPGNAAVRAEADLIVKMLNDWYQTAFVDPDRYGDGTFPDIAKHFATAARASFTKDIATLTIGDAREEVKRVDPTAQTAKLTVFFDKGKALFAVAAVHFAASATMKKSNAYPLKIDQTMTLNLEKQGEGWVVTFYTANQKQDSVVPSPSATPSSS